MKWVGSLPLFGLLLTTIALCEGRSPRILWSDVSKAAEASDARQEGSHESERGGTSDEKYEAPKESEEDEAEKKKKEEESRECLRTLGGPHDNASCTAFEQRWVNKSDAKGLHADVSTMDLKGVSKKDAVVTVGCYGMYTFAQEMIGECADPKLLLDLLLCQYDYLENKSAILKQFHNVKTRDDIISWMSDFKKCIGTTPYPPPVEDLDSLGEEWMTFDVISVFIEPAKKMRAYIENNNL